MQNKKIMALVGMAAATVLGLAGCNWGDKVTEPFRDAPRSQVVNANPADIIEMPDGFNNLATKCDHGNRIYVSYHGDGTYGFASVVGNDPTCKQ